MQLSEKIAIILCLLSIGVGHSSALAQGGSSAPSPAPVVHSTYPTGTSTPLGRQIAALLANPAVSRAHWGIAVTMLDGTPIYGLDEGKLFRPASNAKLFTTSAAMALLGPESTTTTTASFEEPSPEGVSEGSVYLRSSGAGYLSGLPTAYAPVEKNTQSAAVAKDPDTAPDSLQQIDELAEKIAKSGVKRISGDIVWSDPLWPDRYPEGWSSEDMVWGYGAPVSSLSINDNQIELIITPHEYGGPRASLSPDVGYYQIPPEDIRLKNTAMPADIAVGRVQDSNVLQIFGHIPSGPHIAAHNNSGESGEPYTSEIAIDDPAAFAAQALLLELKERGIEVSGIAKADHGVFPTVGFLLQSHEPVHLPGSAPGGTFDDAPPVPKTRTVLENFSMSRDEDIAFTLKTSQNLHAEFLLKQLGQKWGTGGSTAQGARVVRQWLINAGLDPDDFVFYDGSGLSTKDLVTPRATVQLLAFAAKQPWFAQWKAALPIGGVDGTLESRFTQPSLKRHIFAKTGTMGESRALSGYLDAASGRTIIFSIFVDDHMPATSVDRIAMDKIVAAIAAAE
jgi:D-alanyl-D-alanine carboxypeptidase/D-alanyl-D-alanine-endopeptidase (penicillin-binding protein 4)